MTKKSNALYLSICIPTYNRIVSFEKIVQNYLGCTDPRFNVCICDNCSTDGTWEALSSIESDKLSLHQNEINVGGPFNIIRAMSCGNAEYLLVVLDKDTINVKYLSQFIDILQKEEPSWGIIDLSSKHVDASLRKPKGIDAIRYSSTYAPKHPSGFFIRKEVFEYFMTDGWENVETKHFCFPFEFSQLYFALHYDMLVVQMPLITTEERSIAKKEKSFTYTKNNCWFFYEARREYYSVFLQRVMEMVANEALKKNIIEEMTNAAMKNVSSVLRNWLQDVEICEHYNVECRKVSAKECAMNMNNILNIYKNYALKNNTFSIKFYIGSYGRILKTYFKYSFEDRN